MTSNLKCFFKLKTLIKWFGLRGLWWTLGSPPHPGQLNAVIKAALDLLECDNSESAKALLRAFSGDSATDWPKDGLDLAEIRPDVGQNSSEVVE